MVDELMASLQSFVSSLDVCSLSGDEAKRLTGRFSKGEKMCAAAKAMCARRVADTGKFEGDGARDAASWLAGVSGESKSAANDQLETARQIGKLPRLDDAFRSGELSDRQAHEVARAATLDPSSESDLLETARTSSLNGLREKAEQVAAAARSREDDERRHRRIHAERHLRTWTGSDGAFMGRFSLTPEAGALVMGPLTQLAAGIFKQAWAEGRKEPREAYMADALVALAGGGRSFAGGRDDAPRTAATPSAPASPSAPAPPTPASSSAPAPPSTPASSSAPAPPATAASTPSSRSAGTPQPESPPTNPPTIPDYQIIMRIDLEALVRGSLLPGEECSIDALGHVPVSVVQKYLDLAKVRLVVTEGLDVRSIYSFKRNIGRALDTALHFRDRTCVVPGCDSSFHLQRDHIKEFSRQGPTSLDNLCLLCPPHHRMKTNHGFRIVGGPGRWRWLRPDGTSAGPYEQPPQPQDAH